MPDPTSTVQHPVHPDVRYEKGDARVGTILLIGVGLAAIVFLVQGSSALVFDVLRKNAHREDVPRSPLAASERPRLPGDLKKIPPPRLQVDEASDLMHFRQGEEKRLGSYGWIDPKQALVHIPIAEAMKRLASDPKTAQAHGIRVEEGKR